MVRMWQDYSRYTEAYTVPGDVEAKGADFLTEVESYMNVYSFERGSGTRLATIQASLLFNEQYFIACYGSWGLTSLLMDFVLCKLEILYWKKAILAILCIYMPR